MTQLKIGRTNKVGEQKIRGLTYIPHKQVCTLLNIKLCRCTNDSCEEKTK